MGGRLGSAKPRGSAIAPGRVDGPDSAAQLMFTSGSTGSPKGVVHTHNTLWAAVTGVPNRLGLDRSDRILVPSTMGHQTGFLYGLSMPLIWGVTAVYQDVWNAARFVDLVNAYGVSVVSGSATFVMDACEEVERSGADLPSLRVFRSGGAPCRARWSRAVGTCLGHDC